ncbi:hypothetical protein [Fischerella sp. JS2]|uniref:hypothetical protein n=1 Tax=Fischerella sp. JS2 TaxID=2597771 RepID=UPI0028E8F53F|nr:hypothetical protein [Fischerella sp. JS2]
MKFSTSAMLRNLREKPDLTFARIDHTGITDRKYWQQYFIVLKQYINQKFMLPMTTSKMLAQINQA